MNRRRKTIIVFCMRACFSVLAERLLLSLVFNFTDCDEFISLHEAHHPKCRHDQWNQTDIEDYHRRNGERNVVRLGLSHDNKDASCESHLMMLAGVKRTEVEAEFSLLCERIASVNHDNLEILGPIGQFFTKMYNVIGIAGM
jgi:hypothetical protein